MDVLIVGGTRFLGVEIVRELLAAGHRVALLANEPPPSELAPDVETLLGDRDDAAFLATALDGRRFDAVIDNIGQSPTQSSKLLAALADRLGRILFTSTTQVYSWRFPRAWREDEAPLEVTDLADVTDLHEHYARRKRACERALREQPVPWTVLRPAIVVGRADNVSLPPPTYVARGAPGRSLFYPCRVLDRGPILIRRDDEATAQHVWARDVGRAYALLVGRDDTRGHAYNLAGPEVWTSERLVRALGHAAGLAPETVAVSPAQLVAAGLAGYEPPWGRGPYWAAFDTAKLEALGFRPTPAERWLRTLVEASPGTGPGYELRMREVALARAVRRHD